VYYTTPDIADQKMRSAGYEPIDLGHAVFHEDIRVRTKVNPSLYTKAPHECAGCGAKGQKNKCKYCGTEQ